MKTRYIIYPALLLFTLGVPLARYYTTTPGENACVLEYVDAMDKNNYSGYIYNINGQNHIEPKNSKLASSIEQYKTGRSMGCLMVSNNLFSDLTNTFYCSVTYIIRKTPLNIIK